MKEAREKQLATRPDFFEAGQLDLAIDNASFLRRLNAMIIGKRADAPMKTPASIAAGIDGKGRLHAHLENYRFGKWLLLDGAAGFQDGPGQPLDRRKLLQCVGAALDHLRMSDLHVKATSHTPVGATMGGTASTLQPPAQGRARRKSNLTKHDLSARWNKLFDDDKQPAFFDSHLRSMKRVLPLYLEFIRSGAAIHDGKTISKSPEIEKLLKALTSPSVTKARKTKSPLERPAAPVAAKMDPFEITLRYSADDQQAEYRDPASADLTAACLRYTPKKMSATSADRKIAKGRDGKLVLCPDIDVRKSYRIDALIDRMVILLHTREITTHNSIQGKLQHATGASTKVVIWDARKHLASWGCPFPHVSAPDPERQFAISIQEPTQKLLTQIMSTLEATYGVTGDVLIHMIELSVDFYTKAAKTPTEMILAREKFVGALHRHHWVLPTLLLTDEPGNPRNIDARQQFVDAEGDDKTRYLFSGKKRITDFDVLNPEIRDSILTSNTGERLHLNSTIYKGEKGSNCWISIQHKIADERNTANDTKRDLEQANRRARIEVTLSGSERLSELGTVQNLANTSFRRIGKKYLTFKLPTIDPMQHVLEDAKTQLASRGVFGIELRYRAQAVLEREKAKEAGETPRRRSTADSVALTDWTEMNTYVGEALDALTRRWKRFSRA